MKSTILTLLLLSTTIFAVEPAPNGIAFPEGYQDWSVLSVSHRIDNHTMRVILGNDVAIQAARNGKILPWPDGAVIGKVVWKEKTEQNWPTAIAPDQFVHAEFMFKDNEKWPDQDGWGYARWKGEKLMPYGNDENFSQECIACHTPVKNNDWVFTTPAHIAFPH